MYEVSSNEHADGRKSDIIYLPRNEKITETIPPLLIEIQQVISISFMKRLMRYCLNIHDSFGFFPKVIVFAIKGYSSRTFMNKNFFIEENCSFFTGPTNLWASKLNIYTLDSIAPFVLCNEVMSPIVALSYFLCRQERSIMALDECSDINLRRIYQLANKCFNRYYCSEEGALDSEKDVLERTNSQFEKILNCAMNEDVNLKRIIKYSEDGIEYTKKKQKLRRQDEENNATVTPIEENISADLHFVRKYYQEINGKMNWRDCYEKGTKDNLFTSFGSHLSLKNAYHNGKL